MSDDDHETRISKSELPIDIDAQNRLLEAIDAKIGEVRTEAIDLSFGEIINLKRSDEIKIDPCLSG